MTGGGVKSYLGKAIFTDHFSKRGFLYFSHFGKIKALTPPPTQIYFKCVISYLSENKLEYRVKFDKDKVNIFHNIGEQSI